MQKRVKTTVMLPKELNDRVTDLADQLGVGRNAFLSMGAAMFVTEASRMIKSGRRRTAILKDVEEMFQKIIDEARQF